MHTTPENRDTIGDLPPLPGGTQALVAKIRGAIGLSSGIDIPSMPSQPVPIKEVWNGEGDYAVPLSKASPTIPPVEEIPVEIDGSITPVNPLYSLESIPRDRRETYETDPRPYATPVRVLVIPRLLRDVSPKG